MKYEMKIVDVPGGLTVGEQYTTVKGEVLEANVIVSTACPVTLVTAETYLLLSDEPMQPMEKNLDIGLPYIPTIPNPQRGLIKGFTLGRKPWGDLPVIVCDCEIGYPNPIILGTDITTKCRSFSVDEKNVIIET
jgi:hypothetical protein